MADPPLRCLPTLLQQPAMVSVCGMDADSESILPNAKNLDAPLISKFADETLSRVSDHSMSAEELEEDDLLDDGEEYEKELEDQRILDAKNGHSDGNYFSTRKSTTMAADAAAYIAQSFAAPTMSLDAFVDEEDG